MCRYELRVLGRGKARRRTGRSLLLSKKVMIRLLGCCRGCRRSIRTLEYNSSSTELMSMIRSVRCIGALDRWSRRVRVIGWVERGRQLRRYVQLAADTVNWWLRSWASCQGIIIRRIVGMVTGVGVCSSEDQSLVELPAWRCGVWMHTLHLRTVLALVIRRGRRGVSQRRGIWLTFVGTGGPGVWRQRPIERGNWLACQLLCRLLLSCWQGFWLLRLGLRL